MPETNLQVNVSTEQGEANLRRMNQEFYGVSQAADAVGNSLGRIEKMQTIQFFATLVGTVKDLSHSYVEMGKIVNDFILSQAEENRSLILLSKSIGIVSDDLEAMGNALQINGVGSFEDLVTMSNKLAKSLIDSSGRITATGKSLQGFGVNIYDANGGLRDTGKILEDTIDKMLKLGTSTETTALAAQLFGKSGPMKINSLIAEGYSSVADIVKKVGIGFSTPEQVRALSDYKKNIETLKITWSEVNEAAAGGLAKAFNPILENIQGELMMLGPGGAEVVGLAGLVGKILPQLLTAMTELTILIRGGLLLKGASVAGETIGGISRLLQPTGYANEYDLSKPLQEGENKVRDLALDYMPEKEIILQKKLNAKMENGLSLSRREKEKLIAIEEKQLRIARAVEEVERDIAEDIKNAGDAAAEAAVESGASGQGITMARSEARIAAAARREGDVDAAGTAAAAGSGGLLAGLLSNPIGWIMTVIGVVATVFGISQFLKGRTLAAEYEAKQTNIQKGIDQYGGIDVSMGGKNVSVSSRDQFEELVKSEMKKEEGNRSWGAWAIDSINVFRNNLKDTVTGRISVETGKLLSDEQVERMKQIRQEAEDMANAFQRSQQAAGEIQKDLQDTLKLQGKDQSGAVESIKPEQQKINFDAQMKALRQEQANALDDLKKEAATVEAQIAIYGSKKPPQVVLQSTMDAAKRLRSNAFSSFSQNEISEIQKLITSLNDTDPSRAGTLQQKLNIIKKGLSGEDISGLSVIIERLNKDLDSIAVGGKDQGIAKTFAEAKIHAEELKKQMESVAKDAERTLKALQDAFDLQVLKRQIEEIDMDLRDIADKKYMSAKGIATISASGSQLPKELSPTERAIGEAIGEAKQRIAASSKKIDSPELQLGLSKIQKQYQVDFLEHVMTQEDAAQKRDIAIFELKLKTFKELLDREKELAQATLLQVDAKMNLAVELGDDVLRQKLQSQRNLIEQQLIAAQADLASLGDPKEILTLSTMKLQEQLRLVQVALSNISIRYDRLIKQTQELATAWGVYASAVEASQNLARARSANPNSQIGQGVIDQSKINEAQATLRAAQLERDKGLARVEEQRKANGGVLTQGMRDEIQSINLAYQTAYNTFKGNIDNLHAEAIRRARNNVVEVLRLQADSWRAYSEYLGVLMTIQERTQGLDEFGNSRAFTDAEMQDRIDLIHQQARAQEELSKRNREAALRDNDINNDEKASRDYANEQLRIQFEEEQAILALRKDQQARRDASLVDEISRNEALLEQQKLLKVPLASQQSTLETIIALKKQYSEQLAREGKITESIKVMNEAITLEQEKQKKLSFGQELLLAGTNRSSIESFLKDRFNHSYSSLFTQLPMVMGPATVDQLVAQLQNNLGDTLTSIFDQTRAQGLPEGQMQKINEALTRAVGDVVLKIFGRR